MTGLDSWTQWLDDRMLWIPRTTVSTVSKTTHTVFEDPCPTQKVRPVPRSGAWFGEHSRLVWLPRRLWRFESAHQASVSQWLRKTILSDLFEHILTVSMPVSVFLSDSLVPRSATKVSEPKLECRKASPTQRFGCLPHPKYKASYSVCTEISSPVKRRTTSLMKAPKMLSGNVRHCARLWRQQVFWGAEAQQ